MRTSSVARRYAKALIEIGREENAHDRFGRELRTVLAVFEGNPDLMKVLLNPMFKVEQRGALMDRVCSSLKLSDRVSKFLAILVETRNIRSLESIVAAYGRLEDEIVGRMRATIETPQEPDDALLAAVREKLGGAAGGKEVVLTHRKNPALIGGLVIRIDNTILDGSLRTQLEMMKEKIQEGVV